MGGYNAVKHNRNLEFSHANLKNVRDALAGLFVILATLEILENDGRHRERLGSSWSGSFSFEGIPFELQYENIS